MELLKFAFNFLQISPWDFLNLYLISYKFNHGAFEICIQFLTNLTMGLLKFSFNFLQISPWDFWYLYLISYKFHLGTFEICIQCLTNFRCIMFVPDRLHFLQKQYNFGDRQKYVVCFLEERNISFNMLLLKNKQIFKI